MTEENLHYARRTGTALRSGSSDPKLTRAERRGMVEDLAGHAWFRRCGQADVTALVEIGSRFAVPPHWALMLESTPADSCYAITSGTADVYLGRVKIAELGPGDVVGEMSVLTGTLRRATVTSSTRVCGLRVGNDALIELFARRPQILDVLRGAYVARTAPSHRERVREQLRAAGEWFDGPVPALP